MACILGRKIAMTQAYGSDGELIPVTVIQAGPCKVVSTKTKDKDGYAASVLGFEEIEGAKVRKPLLGFFKKSNTPCYRVIQEFRDFEAQPGAELSVSQFKEGDALIVEGTTKGKGMTSVIKKWNYSRGRMSHGGNCKRKVGSTGMHTWPAHVIKGKKMPGRWGNESMTLRSARIVKVNEGDNLILIKGPIPGSPNALVSLRTLPAKTKKKAA